MIGFSSLGACSFHPTTDFRIKNRSHEPPLSASNIFSENKGTWIRHPLLLHLEALTLTKAFIFIILSYRRLFSCNFIWDLGPISPPTRVLVSFIFAFIPSYTMSPYTYMILCICIKSSSCRWEKMFVFLSLTFSKPNTIISNHTPLPSKDRTSFLFKAGGKSIVHINYIFFICSLDI